MIKQIIILLALTACHSAAPEPPPMKIGAHAGAQPGHIRFGDSHGWCVIQPDGMERCSLLGQPPTIAPPHHPEDRP